MNEATLYVELHARMGRDLGAAIDDAVRTFALPRSAVLVDLLAHRREAIAVVDAIEDEARSA